MEHIVDLFQLFRYYRSNNTLIEVMTVYCIRILT